jgi:hypothetical protein
LYQFHQNKSFTLDTLYTFDQLNQIGWYSLIFVALIGILFYLRYLVSKQREKHTDITWGCGFTGDSEKMQYTASSFIRSYRKLAEPVLLIKKEKNETTGLYPTETIQKTHPEDKIEEYMIDKPITLFRKLSNRFVFLQNGNIQAYILYGFIFIGLILLLPILFEKILSFIQFIIHI